MSGDDRKGETPTPEEVREEMLECRREILARIDQGDGTMAELRDSFLKLEKSVESLLTTYKAGQGFIKFTNWIGKGIIFLGKVLFYIGIIWAAVKIGNDSR